MNDWQIQNGDCVELLANIESSSIDAVVTDPPYPEVSRDYGRMSEEEWHQMMDAVVPQLKRVLKPKGSAVFILQPNFETVGKMRLWLWEFLIKTAKNWNLVQNAYWWNFASIPLAGSSRKEGLMRNSVKYCLWFGAIDCYRCQEEVLWEPSKLGMQHLKYQGRAFREVFPSGVKAFDKTFLSAIEERGGVTPFNLIPLANTDPVHSSGSYGHGSGTPYKLCDWWVRYICPPGGTVLDPFNGAGTVGLAAVDTKRKYIGIEKVKKYCDISEERLKEKS